jgi:gliding motility-associated-like protein
MTDLVNGHTIARSYTNKADTIYSVYFSIIPRNNIMSCVSGDTSLHQVRIHPHPLDTMFLSTPFTCSGGNEGIITAVLSRGSKPDSIYWHRPSFLGDTAYVTSENSTDLNIRYAGYYWVTVYDSLKCSYNWSDYNPLAKAFVSGTTFVTNLSVAGYPTGYDVTCPGASDGIIRIMEDVSSTATPPFEFWLVLNDADTVLNDIIWTKGSIYYANNMAAGQYRLIMRDMNNCYNEPNPITVTEPENISVTFGKKVFEGGYNVSCKGYSDGQVWVSSVTGGNPGGYKYKWYTYDGLITGPDTLDRLDNVSAGTYYLLTTDRYCTKVDSVTLIQPEGMNMAEFNLSYTSDSLFNISCNGGNDGSIDITITGGSGNYTYFWTDSALFSATTRNISNLSAGTYVCEIKDVNGCILRLQPSSALPAFTLTEPAPLDITSVLSASPAGPFNIGCNGGTGSIDISVTGGSEGLYQFKWSASEGGSGIVDGEEDQFSLTAGRYHLEVEDLYGCIAVYDTILTEPDEISTVVVTTNITCGAVGLDNGSIELSVTGGVAPYTYFWTDSVSFSSTDKDISNLGEGTYYVTITDANGCVYIDSAHIELPPAITFTTTLSDRNGYNVSCYGRSDGAIDISLTSGLAPYVFNWSGPDGFTASTRDISGLKAGEYILSITDVNLCSAYDTIILTEPGRLGIDVTLSSSFAGDYQINCAGSSTGSIEVVPVNQAGAVTYLWSDGNTSSLRTGLPEGIYELIITDSNGCHADTTLQLTAPDSIKIEFNITQPLCPDMPDGSIELAVTGGVPGADYNYRWSDNSVNKDLSGIVSGLYSVVVSDMNGCIARDSVFVEPIQELCLIIPNAISPNGDLINDYWNIGLKELYPEIEVKIFNRWGEEIWRSAKGYPDPWDGRSKGSLLPIDSYHYIIDLHNGTKPIMGTVTIVR